MIQVLLNNIVVVNDDLISQQHYKIKKCQVQGNRIGYPTQHPHTRRRSVNWVFNQIGRKLFRQEYNYHRVISKVNNSSKSKLA